MKKAKMGLLKKEKSATFIAGLLLTFTAQLFTPAFAAESVLTRAIYLREETKKRAVCEGALCTKHAVRTGFDFALAPFGIPLGVPSLWDLITNRPWKKAHRHRLRCDRMRRNKAQLKKAIQFLERIEYAHSHLKEIAQGTFPKEQFPNRFWKLLNQLRDQNESLADTIDRIHLANLDGMNGLNDLRTPEDCDLFFERMIETIQPEKEETPDSDQTPLLEMTPC